MNWPWSVESNNMGGGKASFNKSVLNVFTKVGIGSEYLIVIGSWFQIVDTSAENAYLPIIWLVSGTKRCLKTDDLRVLY